MNLQKKFYDDLIWSLRERPNKINDIILPISLKEKFSKMVEKDNIPNMIFHGPSGTGKTTVAVVLSEMTGRDTFYINGNKDSSIDILRGELTKFVSSCSFGESEKKIVIIDEADAKGRNAMLQGALKSFIEEFSKSASFIFITNFINLMDKELLSRLQQVDFNFSQEELVELKKQFAKVVLGILSKENIDYDKKVLGFLVKKFFPDMRKCLNEIQNLAEQNRLTDPSIINEFGGDMEVYYSLLRSRDFTGLQNFVSQITDSQSFYTKIYDTCKGIFVNEDIPGLIILTNEYSYKANFVADQRINLMAYSCEIMNNVKLVD